jgi:hypothetical protein
MKKIGRIIETGGNILTDSIQNDKFSPPALLGHLAKAYPARDPITTDNAVEDTEIIILFNIDDVARGFVKRNT